MDYVYICRSGENEELRYSIRSIVKNCNVNNVWLIGNKPSWYKGNYISVEYCGNKFQNNVNCLKIIANNPEISDDFVLMNDDFFVIKPIDKVETYNGGLLQNKINKYVASFGMNEYARLLKHVNKALLKVNIKVPLDYDIHVPIVFNKKKLKSLSELTLAPRSVYGNIFEIGGKTIDDVKIYSTSEVLDFNKLEIPFISTMDETFKVIEKQIKEMFPDKSDFEN